MDIEPQKPKNHPASTGSAKEHGHKNKKAAFIIPVFVQFLSACLFLFLFSFQKRKIPIIITKLLSFLRQENRTVVA